MQLSVNPGLSPLLFLGCVFSRPGQPGRVPTAEAVEKSVLKLDKLKSVGSLAFVRCDEIVSVSFAALETVDGYVVFDSLTNLKSISFPVLATAKAYV